jgi:drug/metabolite transporter (DMT)-like permease
VEAFTCRAHWAVRFDGAARFLLGPGREKGSTTVKSGFIFGVLAAFLWGFTGVPAKLLFRGVTSPFALAEVRLTLSAAFLGLFLLLTKRALLRIERRDIPYFAVFGMAGVAMVQFTYLYTMSLTSVATVVFLQSLSVPLMFLWAALTKGERLTPVKMGALALAMAGSYLIIQGTGGHLAVSGRALIVGLSSAFFAAFYTVLGKRGLAKDHPLTVLFWGLAFGAVPWWFILPPARLVAMGFGVADLLFFVYIALFSTVIPFSLYFRGLRDLTPGQAGIIGTLEPVVASLAAWLILGESLGWLRAAGAALVLVGVLMLRLLAPAGDEADAPSSPQPVQSSLSEL